VFEVDAEPDRGSAEPGAEVGPGTPAIVRRFRVLVKAVREKQLPALTDEWAAESSEFVTVDELRDELRSRIAAVKRERTTMMARQRSLEALAELVVDDEIPSILVQDEVERRVHDLSHRLEEQGIGFERFLQMTGRTGEDLVTQIRSESHAMVKVDLALRALAEAEGIEVSDEAITDRIDAMASSLGTEARKLRRQLEDSGRIVALRSELRKELASEWLFDHVELFDENGIEVPRDALAQEDAGTLEAVGGGASTDVSLEPGKGDGQ
jgi:trigger factor